MTRPAARPRVDDTGASLVIVLAFVVGVMVIAGSLLAYSGTSLGGVESTKYRSGISYDLDGALKAGINQVRVNGFDNDYAGQDCDLNGSDAGGTLLAEADATNSKQRTAVTCAGGPGTGIDGGLVGISDQNKPGQAILTLGNGAGGEVGIQQNSNSILRIKGKVFTNANVSIPASAARLDVLNAELHARLGCDQPEKVTSLATPACGTAAIPTDPNYTQPAGPLTWQRVPNCVPGGVVEFTPGFYDDATAMNSLMSSCTALFWFPAGDTSAPARYYFDFATNGGLWQLSNSGAAIVAGQPSGWSPTSSSALSDARARIGGDGSCVNPLKTEGAKGAQFVFGGTSRLAITSGYVEICGKYTSTTPMLPIYGAKSAIPATTTGPTPTAMTTTTSQPGSGTGAWTQLGRTAPGDSDAAASVTAMPASSTSALTLTGFNPSGGIGSGQYLTSAVLEVRHREVDSGTGGNAGKVNGLELMLTPSRSGASTLTKPVSLNGGTGPALRTDSIDLTSDLANEIKLNGWTGATVTYAAATNNKPGAAAYLESIVLKLTWRTPTLTAQSGCITATPYASAAPSASAGTCPVLYTSGAQSKLYIQGTTYVPRAAVDLNMTNISTQVMRAGLIARTLAVGVTPSASYGGPVIEVPDNALGPRPTDVYFRAYYCALGTSCSPDPAVCPAGAPAAGCATEQQRATAGGWRVGATSRATFTDAVPGSPSPGARAVNVRSWTINR